MVPMPLRKYCDLSSLTHARIDVIADVAKQHVALDEVHKNVSAKNTRRRTQVQKIHSVRTNVTPITLDIDDYVLIRMHAKKNHKLKSTWRGQMRVIKSKSDLVFIVEKIASAQQHTMHAQKVFHIRSHRRAPKHRMNQWTKPRIST